MTRLPFTSNGHRRRVSTGRRRRRSAMTMVETMISVLVGITVMGTAYLFYDSSIKSGRKAYGLSSAAQVAAQFFYALEQDIANISPKPSAEETINVVDDLDPAATQGERQFWFNRTSVDKAHRIEWKSQDHRAHNNPPIVVAYKAVLNQKTKLWDITREYDIDNGREIRPTSFHGAWAKDVRFSRVSMKFANGHTTKHFLRVSLLLVGDVDPTGTKAALESKPILLSTLFAIPVSDGSAPVDPLDQ